MYKNQNKGIAAGIAAGCFWGTPFIVPIILSGFSSFEITFGRFFFFGIISLISLPRIIKLIKRFNSQQLIQIFLLSASGFWLYSLILFAGVQLTNGVVASLIIGCMPLTITLFSKPKWSLLLNLGLALIILGMLFLLIVPLLNHANSIAKVKISGVMLLFIALVTWTWFGIKNSQFMQLNKDIKAIDYSSLIGLINLSIILPAFMLFHGFTPLLQHSDIFLYLFWSLILGVGASWIANIFWAYSAKHCPPAIGGALIVSETIFGVIYSFIFEQRWPYINEVLAIVCLISGVVFVINSQRLGRLH